MWYNKETRKVIGTVWVDANKDGVKDANEQRVSGVKVLLLNNNTEIFSSYIREYSTLLYIFTFILITNFNSWYILWLFPTLMFLNGKNIRLIINLSYAVEVAYIGSFALYSEAQNLGVLYIFLVAIVTGILTSVPMVKNKVEYLSNKIEIKK